MITLDVKLSIPALCRHCYTVKRIKDKPQTKGMIFMKIFKVRVFESVRVNSIKSTYLIF